MHLVEIIRRPDTVQIDEMTSFVDRVTETRGARPLSDHLWLDLRSGGAEGFLAVRVADEQGWLALAQISAGNDSSSLEIVLAPEAGRRVRDDAARTAVDAFRRHGGGRLFWWLDDPDDELLHLVDELGLSPGRALYEMRRPLPAPLHATVDTRAFRPGSDDAEWLDVNNRAFAEHGEQGGWTAEALAQRITEPWFDADGFRIHERDGRIAAFCWTKLHRELDPVVGEIYVIAVDPDFHGLGLGKELTLAGLDWMSDRGIGVASLFVDADNTPAVGLYHRLGFTVHHTRRACAGDLESA